MPDPSMTCSVAPTGGIVVLKLASSAPAATWSLVRGVVSGGTTVGQTILFTGPSEVQPVFLDIGDGLKTPLDPTQQYEYTFTTGAGVATSGPVQPSAEIELEPDHMTAVLLRGLQSGVRSLKLPAAFKNAPSVFHAMPMGSIPTLPMISLNETLLQQGDIPIGQNNLANLTSNSQVVGGQALRHYTIAVLTLTVEEREYYRDAVLGIINALLGPVFEAIGENSTHRFQVNSSQVTGDAMMPGFYFAEILWEFTGTFSVGVSTTYGVVEQIVGTVNSTELFIDS